jgi:hypothetical protein
MDTISFQCPLCTPLTSSLYDLQLIWNVYVGRKRMESVVHKVAFRHRRSRSKLWLVFSKSGLLVQYSIRGWSILLHLENSFLENFFWQKIHEKNLV